MRPPGPINAGRADGGGSNHRFPRLPLLAVALVLGVVGCASVRAPAPAPGGTATAPEAPEAATGLVGGAGFSEGASMLGRSDTDLATELDGMVAAGARYVRVDVYWALVQPTPTTWEWGPVDRLVDGARARGLQVLGILDYTPAWARPAGTDDKTPPTDAADFAAFSRAAVERYGPRGVHAWEVWNEPNIDLFWQPAPDPAGYARLLQAAHDAIKGADPGATVVAGGLSPAPNAPDGSAIAPVDFLEGVYAAGGADSFDALGHHPSNYPNMPSTYEPDYNDNAFAGVTPRLYETMVKHGDGDKRIWGTEMGAPTVDGMTADYVARYVTEAYRLWAEWAFTGPLFWYSYLDAGTDPNDAEDHFGLVRRDFTPKEPALQAYRDAAQGSGS